MNRRPVRCYSGPITAPGYLPEIARPVLPWARRHVARVARRYHTGESDLWDETITALLRASLHYDPCMGAFNGYAHTAIHRACWRYVCRAIASPSRPHWLVIVPPAIEAIDPEASYLTQGARGAHAGDEIDLDLALDHAMASSEEEVMAREAVWLRAHSVSGFGGFSRASNAGTTRSGCK